MSGQTFRLGTALAGLPAFVWHDPAGYPSHLKPGKAKTFHHNFQLAIHPQAGWGSVHACEVWSLPNDPIPYRTRAAMLTLDRASLLALYRFIGETLGQAPGG